MDRNPRAHARTRNLLARTPTHVQTGAQGARIGRTDVKHTRPPTRRRKKDAHRTQSRNRRHHFICTQRQNRAGRPPAPPSDGGRNFSRRRGAQAALPTRRTSGTGAPPCGVIFCRRRAVGRAAAGGRAAACAPHDEGAVRPVRLPAVTPAGTAGSRRPPRHAATAGRHRHNNRSADGIRTTTEHGRTENVPENLACHKNNQLYIRGGVTINLSANRIKYQKKWSGSLVHKPNERFSVHSFYSKQLNTH